MKKNDRQFMVILGLVIATGLVMGLIAFRMTAGGSAAAATAAVKPIGGDPNAPKPSAADEASAQDGSSGSTESQASDQVVSKDGEATDVATPEPAAPPPPPPPVATVEEPSDYAQPSGETQS
ncbi:hypothetical protein FPZ24_07095 [Sphingomonas panacisoli]|uniref:Uncharacterized protein n=1 Tax=Sphingomonas panacisoli TaxID=1813879 RepID=A0A5B8LI11_9SPHN|nr:hypothetical protein [Sphingomonas panacisoli]QDZ07272.1 hypothetical protein FPZ24_07095 [Sphingomonas panacisoli]